MVGPTNPSSSPSVPLLRLSSTGNPKVCKNAWSNSMTWLRRNSKASCCASSRVCHVQHGVSVGLAPFAADRPRRSERPSRSESSSHGARRSLLGGSTIHARCVLLLRQQQSHLRLALLFTAFASGVVEDPCAAPLASARKETRNRLPVRGHMLLMLFLLLLVLLCCGEIITRTMCCYSYRGNIMVVSLCVLQTLWEREASRRE
mmetsp:Transcript_10065/g.27592  ORF Transcript_10065/g.27592 Transcript_10065/m.27592 type:complete len:203 (+) Transcript_10065:825-1433(+)